MAFVVTEVSQLLFEFSNIDPQFSISGSVVDVGKLLGQLKRSEKARSDTESQLKSAQKTVQEYKEATEKFNSSKEKLQVRNCIY